MDKRNFTRVEYSGCASIKHDNQTFFGDVKSISLQGIFIKAPQEISINVPVEITIYDSCNISYRFYANVVRLEENGIGMQIEHIDIESFVHLRNIVAKQCKDDDLIMRETYKMADCIHWKAGTA